MIFILILMLLLSSLAVAARLALVIGNGDYSGSPLRNPENDAHDMAATLRSLDFEVIEKTNLNKRNLERAAESFEDRIRSDDVALFYYSGHGLQVDGANYLIPLQADIDEENDVRYEAVELNRILEKLAKAKLNIIILDACRDNPFKGVRSSSKGLAQIAANKVGTFIAYSTAPGSVAADGTGRNSPYTKHLIEQMQTDLKIEDAFKEVRKSVVKETNDKQNPWDSSCLVEDFYFCMGCAPKITEPQVIEHKRDNAENYISDMGIDMVFVEGGTFSMGSNDGSALSGLRDIELTIEDGLVAYYSFNGDATDESGNDYNGTVYDATLSIDRFGVENCAYSFDGLNDWIEVLHSDDLDFNNNRGDEYSAICWIKTTDSISECGRIITKHESDGNWDPGYLLGVTYGHLHIAFETISATQHLLITGSNIDDGQWHQIGFTLDATLNELKLYLDGALEASADISDGSSSNTFPLSIGSRNGTTGSWFDGQIDDVQIYNRALSETEIAELYNSSSDDGDSHEKPVHSVTVSDFYIGKYEVMQGDYKAVVGTNPAKNYGVGRKYPVYYVSWYEAVEYCNKISDKEGFERCYTGTGDDIRCDFNANGYRLPTEAEWDYTAKGGNKSNGYRYAGSNDIGSVAWYDGNSGDKTHSAGGKQANELGIYDMSGNIWEWCWDWYGDHSSSAQSNPRGQNSGSTRVYRGGSLGCSASGCLIANRGNNFPALATRGLGFRIARSSK